ncbi:type VI secretion system-associated FHA domain protein TagH [Burkholderia sp. Ac-20353]|uniref:type VI secretion system-associated FHA domain protein TagH n=1 Tax=Burkholderia sp. Ac-20353 TaxID=2703894 RepID=UPI00197B65BB|nr:type VI secretion system-associated FHA domain protein TagH [Burkholderia sp. Ac-20353]MBN3787887.1 type VI secretion system-associated FHA domain protein TagH [Burkholderia sp. Ac-20353]
MQLIVIEHAGEPVDGDQCDAVVFHPPGGTIGRASDNHLVLHDDTRQISRLQALLQVGDDACLLRNLSSVSTIEVNRVPIGYAQEQRLNSGDIIRIGPYVLRAERDDAAALERTVDVDVEATTAASATTIPPHTDATGTGHRLWGRLHDRFGRGKAAFETGSLASSRANERPAERVAARPAGKSAEWPRGTPPDHPDAPAAAPRDLNQLSTDPLDLFMQPAGSVDSPRGTADPAPSSTQADHAPDWTQHVRVQPAAASAGTPPDANDATQSAAPFAEPFAESSATRATEPATPDALLRAFFEGAGLDAAADPHRWSAEQLYIAGQLLGLFANGTVELLSSRSILKREVKAHMTMLLDRENNPLKMLPDGGAVLRQMFGLPLPGFMSPQSAVHDAFQDLHAHQIGMVAGMRAALMDLLTRFSPQRLRERDTAPRWYEKRLPVLYKARMWDRYAATHRDTVFAIEDDFASVFGKAFLAAYDAEVESYRGGGRH